MSELYHVLNRGVEKRDIFLDDRDRARFVHDMWEFNHTRFADNVRRRSGMTDLRSPSSKDSIVQLHGWCLMPNHYHLLVSESVESGLTSFIRRLNIGYAKYFNERYARSGTLFQGRTKKIHISNDAHFLHILQYIHLNPLDLKSSTKTWRSGTIENKIDALHQLRSYRWSSYLDYTGAKNFPSILTTELFSDIFASFDRELSSSLHSLCKMPYDLEHDGLTKSVIPPTDS